MSSICEIARARFGIEVQASGRFSMPGWRYLGLARVGCPDCHSSLHETRKPFVADGRDLEYRAYVCPGCPRIWDRKGLVARLLP